MYGLLNPSNGLVNQVIGLFGGTPRNFMIQQSFWIPYIVLTGLWKNIGWGSILYLAAITGINPELHEAAMIDGANRFQRVWHIVLPGILPTICILLILQIGGIMNSDYLQFQALMQPVTYPVADVLDTYILRTGLMNGMYSYTAAIGLFKNIIVVFLILGTNWAIKKMNQEPLF